MSLTEGEWLLRQANDDINPTLMGGVYAAYITACRPVYVRFDGARTRGVLFISDGGNYGLDSVSIVEYKSHPLVEGVDYIFHRGTFTKQVVAKAITSVNTTSNAITVTSHGYSNTNLVRVRVTDGDLPAPLLKTEKYQIANATTNTFTLKSEDGATDIDLTTVGSGNLIVWKADAGFDDPEQGLPEFVPEVNTTFNNIAYIEFILPATYSNADEAPDWADFRVVGVGRRLMNYSNVGAELGVIAGDFDLLSNAALIIMDNLLVNYKIKSSRIHWASWFALKTSSATLIWQRTKTIDTGVVGAGFVGRYYQGLDFTDLRETRLDPNIDIGSSTVAPVSGMTINGFSVRWNAKIKPQYSENYTFTLIHDDIGKLWINGQLIIDNAAFGTDTGQMRLENDKIYDVQVELVQTVGVGTNPYECRLKWQSASQAFQLVPATNAYPVSQAVKRHEIHAAFSQTEASEVHERFIERCVGWDWTDDDGLIQFLPPDRAVAFAFSFDRLDDDSKPNFAHGTFKKNRRPMSDRKNFKVFRYRNVQLTGYPFAYAQGDRENLRRFTHGIPTNEPPIELGVATLSLAERMAEMEMVRKVDPAYTATLGGDRKTSKLRKCDLITVSYYDLDGNFVVDDHFIVTFCGWGESNGGNSFTLLPTPYPFYEDEEYTEA